MRCDATPLKGTRTSESIGERASGESAVRTEAKWIQAPTSRSAPLSEKHRKRPSEKQREKEKSGRRVEEVKSEMEESLSLSVSVCFGPLLLG